MTNKSGRKDILYIDSLADEGKRMVEIIEALEGDFHVIGWDKFDQRFMEDIRRGSKDPFEGVVSHIPFKLNESEADFPSANEVYRRSYREGLDILDEIKITNPHIPVVAYSGIDSVAWAYDRSNIDWLVRKTDNPKRDASKIKRALLGLSDGNEKRMRDYLVVKKPSIARQDGSLILEANVNPLEHFNMFRVYKACYSCRGYPGRVSIIDKDSNEIDAKSILSFSRGILSLPKKRLEIRVEGKDEAAERVALEMYYWFASKHIPEVIDGEIPFYTKL